MVRICGQARDTPLETWHPRHVPNSLPLAGRTFSLVGPIWKDRVFRTSWSNKRLSSRDWGRSGLFDLWGNGFSVVEYEMMVLNLRQLVPVKRMAVSFESWTWDLCCLFCLMQGIRSNRHLHYIKL